MIIKKKGITYNYADDGEAIVSAKVDYSSYESRNSLNATVSIVLDMIDGAKSWDDVTPRMMDDAAREEIQKWVNGTDDAPTTNDVETKEEDPNA